MNNHTNIDEFLRFPSYRKDTALHVSAWKIGVNQSQSEVVQTPWVSLTLSDVKMLEEALTINAFKTQ